MTKILAIALSLIGFQRMVFADAAATTNAVAGHNALHYVMSLVEQKQLDPAYTTAFKKMEIAVNEQGGTITGYTVRVEQIPASDGMVNAVEIAIDATGKAGSYTEIPGMDPFNAPVWPTVNAINLATNSFHYLMHNVDSPEMGPFSKSVQSVTLSQEKAADGKVTARVDVKAIGLSTTLRIIEGTDGTVQTATVVQE